MLDLSLNYTFFGLFVKFDLLYELENDFLILSAFISQTAINLCIKLLRHKNFERKQIFN